MNKELIQGLRGLCLTLLGCLVFDVIIFIIFWHLHLLRWLIVSLSIFAIWMIKEMLNAPEMDDHGNLVERR